MGDTSETNTKVLSRELFFRCGSTKNAYKEKSLFARHGPFSQVLSHMCKSHNDYTHNAARMRYACVQNAYMLHIYILSHILHICKIYLFGVAHMPTCVSFSHFAHMQVSCIRANCAQNIPNAAFL